MDHTEHQKRLRALIGDDLMGRLQPTEIAVYSPATGRTVVRFRIGPDPLNRCLAIDWDVALRRGEVSAARQLVNDTGNPAAKPRFLVARGQTARFVSLAEAPGAVAEVVSRIDADPPRGW